MIFKVAFRSIFRNRRRSLMTLLAIAIGGAAMIVFAAYALYDTYILQTTVVQRGGHLTVYRKGFLDFGSSDLAIWGIADYGSLVSAIKADPVLAPMTAVVTPVQYLAGIAQNPEAHGSRTFFSTGFVPADQERMHLWNELGIGTGVERTTLRTEDPNEGVIGFGLARYLGLCERLKLDNCPKPPEGAPTRDRADELQSLPRQDFSGLAEAAKEENTNPRITLLAATAGGAPNIVSLKIERVERQAAREMDDGYVVMNLTLAQQLVYGRDEPRATGIVLQLHRTEDVAAARARLNEIIGAKQLPLEVRDYLEINPWFGQTIDFFRSMFSFIALIIGIVVLFTVSNTMGMSVVERTAEIGTTRALGLRRSGIRRQFLLEGALLGIAGATLAIGFAAASAAAINNTGMTWTPPGDAHPIPLKLYVFGAADLIAVVWILLVVVATVAALLPSHRAARLQIVDALRHV